VNGVKSEIYWGVFLPVIVPCLIQAGLVGVLSGADVNGSNSISATVVQERKNSWEQRLKKPVDWLSWGVDFRWRNEFYSNKKLERFAPGHEEYFQRYRTRLWFDLEPAERLTLRARWIWEPRHYFKPDGRKPLERNEAIFDEFNIKWRAPGETPVTVTVGRQSLRLGEWLIFEGTPLDGSRTRYFDAARLKIDWASRHTTLDLVYIDQGAQSGRWLPVVNSQHFLMAEDNSRAAVVYLVNKSLPGTQFDAYYMFKHDEPALPSGNHAQIHIFGGRAQYQPGRHWNLSGELTPEFGWKNGRTLEAQSFSSQISYLMRDSLNNQFRVTYEYLSGDDPNTPVDEGFDPVWSRGTPRLSEVLSPIFATEARGRPTEWSNFQRLGAGWSFYPASRWEFLIDYSALFANTNPMRGKAGFSGDGSFRGHLVIGRLNFGLTHKLSGHILGELFFPGNYYAVPKGGLATFIRTELTIQL